ncbi:MAG: type II secretion system protein [Cyanobacteria bacterium P01_D01_bin.156]
MAKKRLFKSASSTSGFSLLEALVVVALVGIISAFAGPGWLTYLNRRQVSSARTDLLQALRQAQTDARQQNSSRVVNIVSTTNPPQIQIGSTAGSGRVVDLGEENAAASLSVNGGSLAGGAASSVTFDYKGTLDDDVVPFVFSVTSDKLNDGGVRCVVVTTLLGNLIQAEGDNCNNLAGYEN